MVLYLSTFMWKRQVLGYTLTTPKGKYTLLSLVKHNHFKCTTSNGVAITFVPKKIVADLSFEVL
ncbi:hypothetical protein JZU46_00530 [bacterium]|nr:hypothetical protein [bacterium]